ncbi:MAG: hypothetical protein ACD_4C00163G0002 [uncultured bacterium (gcode 4)]|uniref:Uncharacterized protein n=1 Tax=uncultured bacterium (gcode 4) TaxID=1234023 RepID=K2GTS5_9BACT|nr:MAG: hypothetical protein ACD_4C00163G0002 [uncultured bacterium (gcode 4)]
MDIIASKYTEFFDENAFFAQLSYAEVKKRTNPIIFFERKCNQYESRDSLIPISATKTFFSNIDSKISLKYIINFETNHHQVNHDYISTQFCEVYRNGKKIKAGHNSSYESLILPLLKCVDAEIVNINKTISLFDQNTKRFVFYLFQPIIIISGPLYSYNLHDNSLTEKDYILYRRHHRSSTVKRSLLIDVVRKDSLSKYISEKLSFTYNSIEKSFKGNLKTIIQNSIDDETHFKENFAKL